VTNAPLDPVDSSAREQAIRERRRNLILDAGPGTGKTTTLVERLVQMVAPDDGSVPVGLDRIAAVTFTRRAAGELRLRVRERLLAELHDESTSQARRACLRRALSEVDTAAISTIHGFADRLLRMQPVAARLSPTYEIIEGVDGDELIEEAFELLMHGSQHGTLARELSGIVPPDVATEAAEIVGDALRAGLRQTSREKGEFWTDYGLDALVESWIRSRDMPPQVAPGLGGARIGEAELVRIRGAMTELVTLARKIPDSGAGSFGVWAHQLADTIELIRESRDPAVLYQRVGRSIVARRRSSNHPKKGSGCEGNSEAWTFWKAMHVGGKHRDGQPGSEADAIGDVICAPLASWLAHCLLRLRPLALELYDKVKARHRVVDQIDLLLQLRDLLRDNTRARGFYQAQFDHVFVDEFQDTDPLQAEILVWLCENGALASRWQDAELAEAKLTIVGDPKQSIYRFRRADIAIYEAVRAKIAPSALEARLVTNFRSVPSIVEFVNTSFRSLLGEDDRGREFDAESGRVFHSDVVAGRPEPGSVPGVHVLNFAPSEAQGTSAEAVRMLEARLLPQYLRWLVEDSGQTLVDPLTRETRTIGFGDICVLTLATTHLSKLFGELDRWGVPYSSAGGSLFLRDALHRQFLLGLRALGDRDDGVAQAALLRPPFFSLGVDDACRARAGQTRAGEPIEIALDRIRELRRRRFERSPGETARDLLESTGIARVAALGPNGPQRLARLREVCHLLETIAYEDRLDYDAASARLREWVDKPAQIDAPRPVDGDAVSVLTVHQAKGLEFPVVVLWDSRAALEAHRQQAAWQVGDDGRSWQVAIEGLTHGEPVPGAFGKREKHYRDEERKRVVYVACTRARDLLVVPRTSVGKGKPIHSELVEHVPGAMVHELAVAVDGAVPRAWSPSAETWSWERVETSPQALAEQQQHERVWREKLAAASAPRLRPTPVVLASHAAETEALRAGDFDEQPSLSATPRAGRHGPLFGTTVHRAIELLVEDGDLAVGKAVARASSETGLRGLREEVEGDVTRAIDCLKARGWWRCSGVEFQCEYPVCGSDADGNLLIGSIDLLVEDGSGLHVIDFKTDQPVAAASEAPHYARQVRMYAELVTRASRGRAAATPWLLFTADGGMHEG